MRLLKLTLCLATGLLFCVKVCAADPSRAFAWTVVTVKPAPNQPAGYLQFQNYCAICHGQGSDRPGTLALAAKYSGELPALLEQRTDLDPQVVRQFVRHGISVMPPFRKTELSDADLDAIIAYLTRRQR